MVIQNFNKKIFEIFITYVRHVISSLKNNIKEFNYIYIKEIVDAK